MRDLSFDSDRHQRDFKFGVRMYGAWAANQQKLFDIEAAAIRLGRSITEHEQDDVEAVRVVRRRVDRRKKILGKQRRKG